MIHHGLVVSCVTWLASLLLFCNGCCRLQEKAMDNAKEQGLHNYVVLNEVNKQLAEKILKLYERSKTSGEFVLAFQREFPKNELRIVRNKNGETKEIAILMIDNYHMLVYVDPKSEKLTGYVFGVDFY